MDRNKDYRLSLGSTHSVFCFTGDKLWNYRFDSLESESRNRIFRHLQQCRNCQELYLALPPQRTFDSELPYVLSAVTGLRKKILARLSSEKPVIQTRIQSPAQGKVSGQIWITKPGPHGIGFPCLVINAPNDDCGDEDCADTAPKVFRVISIASDIAFAEDYEPKFAAGDTVLGYDCFLPLFSEWPVLESHLYRYLGSLSDEQMTAIRQVRSRYLRGHIGRRKVHSARKWWQADEMMLCQYLASAVWAYL